MLMEHNWNVFDIEQNLFQMKQNTFQLKENAPEKLLKIEIDVKFQV